MKTSLFLSLIMFITGCVPRLSLDSSKGKLEIKKLLGNEQRYDVVSFSNAKLILDNHCINCHSVGGSASTYNFDFSSEEEFKNSNYVTAADLRSSSLFHRIKGAGVGPVENMPPSGKGLTSNEIELLKKWILNMKRVEEYKVSLQIVEGNSGIESIGGITVRVSLNKEAVKDLIIPFSVTGDAQEGLDYAKVPSNLVIAKGSRSVDVLVNILDDDSIEDLERIQFALGTYSDSEVNVSLDTINVATFFITDNDVSTPTKQLYVVNFLTQSSSLNEEVGQVNIAIEIDKLASEQLLIPVTLSGDAIVGSDYTLSSNNIIINEGQKNGTIQLNILNDNEYENDEIIKVALSSVSNNEYDVVLGSSNSFNMTIIRNDVPDVPSDPIDSFAQVKLILQEKCLSCHSSSGAFPALAFDFNTELEFINSKYVTPKKLAESSLYYRLKNAGLGIATENMPTNSLLDEADREKIRSWILNLKQPVVNYTAQFIELDLIENKKLESDENFSIKVQLDKIAQSDIEIDFSNLGDASVGVDYALINSKIKILKGTNQGFLQYRVIADTNYESNEDINFNLLPSRGEGYQIVIGEAATFKYIIEDDEMAGQIAIRQDALEKLKTLKTSLEVKKLESETHQLNSQNYSTNMNANKSLISEKKNQALLSNDISVVQAIFYEIQTIKQNSDTLKVVTDKIVEDKIALSNSVENDLLLSQSYANKLEGKLTAQEYIENKTVYDQIQIIFSDIDLKLTNYLSDYQQISKNFEEIGAHLMSLQSIINPSFPSSLVAYYSFDNNQWDENFIRDSSKNNNDLLNISAKKIDNGKFGQAIDLNGSNELAYTMSLDSNDWSEFTLLAWIKPNELGDVRIFSKSSSTEQTSHILSLGIINERIRLRMTTDGMGGENSQYDSLDGLIKVNEWAQIGASWSSAKGEVKLYYNGLVVSVFNHEGDSIENSIEPFVLGNVNLSDSRYFNGSIDEVSVFNKVITDDDVLLLSMKTVEDNYRKTVINDGIALKSGTVLYNENCMSCHDALNISEKRGKSFIQIREAINGISVMKNIQLNNAEIKEIEKVLDTLDDIDGDSGALTYNCSIDDYKNALPSKLRKLSKIELMNTYRSLVSSLNEIDIALELSLIPDDPEQLAENFQYEMPSSHFETIMSVASNIALKISSNNLYLSTLAGVCALETNITETCLKNFIVDFGNKAYRRPLTVEEVNSLYSLTNNSNIQTNNDKFMIVLMSILQSPNLLFIYDMTKTIEQIGKENIEKRNQYEIASLISYGLTQSPPDQALLDAAAAEELDSIENLKLHANRLITSSRGRENVKNFIYDWLELYRASDPSSGAAFLGGVDGSGLKNEAINSTKEFGARVIVDRLGTLTDLLSTNNVYVNTNRIAGLYGVSNWSVTDLIPVSNNRAGILATPAMTMDGGYYSSIVSRGVRIRRKVLCDELPSPDFASIQSRENIPTPSRSIASNRQYWTQFTMEDKTCLACHKNINHIGHIFENIDSMGRTRTIEKIYNDDGTKVMNVHEVVTHDSPEIYIGDTLKVDNVKDLGFNIATSSKGKSCFVKKVFEYTFKTKYQDKYSCFLSGVEDEFKDDESKMIDVFVNLIASKYSLAKLSSD